MTLLVIAIVKEWESRAWNPDAVYCLGMSRHCERPGCSKVGEIIYEVDLRRLVVTIDFPDLNDASPMNLLCRRHADSLTVPKGWTIINNREEVQRLFSAPVTQEVSSNNSRKVFRRPRVSDFNGDENNPAANANLFDLVIDDHLFEAADHAAVDASTSLESEITADIRADETADVTADETADFTGELAELMDTQQTQALPWTPRFDRSGDLDGKLRARGRLLGRAFGHIDSSSSDQENHHDHDHDQSHSEF